MHMYTELSPTVSLNNYDSDRLVMYGVHSLSNYYRLHIHCTCMNTCNVTLIGDSHDFQFLPISRPTHSLMEQVWYDI